MKMSFLRPDKFWRIFYIISFICLFLFGMVVSFTDKMSAILNEPAVIYIWVLALCWSLLGVFVSSKYMEKVKEWQRNKD